MVKIFKQKVIKSFQKVRQDIDNTKEWFNAWINHFNSENQDLQERVKELEMQVQELREMLNR